MPYSLKLTPKKRGLTPEKTSLSQQDFLRLEQDLVETFNIYAQRSLCLPIEWRSENPNEFLGRLLHCALSPNPHSPLDLLPPVESENQDHEKFASAVLKYWDALHRVPLGTPLASLLSIEQSGVCPQHLQSNLTAWLSGFLSWKESATRFPRLSTRLKQLQAQNSDSKFILQLTLQDLYRTYSDLQEHYIQSHEWEDIRSF